jgi:hypothetical protein
MLFDRPQPDDLVHGVATVESALAVVVIQADTPAQC